MFVVRTDRPWSSTPFTFQGFVLSSPHQVEWIKEHCEYVYILHEKKGDDARRLIRALGKADATADRGKGSGRLRKLFSARGAGSSNQGPISQGARSSPVVRLYEELPQAREAYDAAKAQVDQLTSEVRLGRALGAMEVKMAVQSLVNSVVRNPDALLWLTNLKSRDEYTALHSLNVCILSVAFGRHLRMNEQDLVELGIGGLLHDIGKMRIPSSLLNKTGKLTQDEFEIIKQHTVYGREVLAKSTALPLSSGDIAYSHHERLDGSGYPQGASGESLSLFARLVSVVDFYDAITTNRAYRDGVNSTDALQKMYGYRTGQFDEDLVYDFIRFIGVYPVGSVVELRNGEIGVVTATNTDHRIRPVVTLLLDSTGNPYYPERILDLAKLRDSEEAAEHTIVRTHDIENFGRGLPNMLVETVINRVLAKNEEELEGKP